MQILIQTSNNKDFIIVQHRLCSEEFFRFFERTLVHSIDFIGLRVVLEAIAYPTVVTAEDEDFGVVESKAAKCISWAPQVVLVDML